MASRNQLNQETEEQQDVDDGFGSLGYENKPDVVILWDYDTMLHFCLYSGKNPDTGERNPEYGEDDIEFVQGKLTEMTLKILNKIENRVNPLAVYIWGKGKGNFRKDIYPEYKAHRPPPNPLINKLYEYARVAHQMKSMDGCEAEDAVYTLSCKINHSGVIVAIDSDTLSIPGLHYNYKLDKWFRISEEEAIYYKYKKLCLSDVGDGVKTTPGIGIKYFEKNFKLGMSEEEYEEQLWKAYLKAWKNDENKAKEQLELGKQLLLLKNMENC